MAPKLEPPAVTEAWIEAALARASEEGARKALAALGLGDEAAAEDLRDLRSTLAVLRTVKASLRKRMLDGAVNIIVGVLAALFAVGWWNGRPPP